MLGCSIIKKAEGICSKETDTQVLIQDTGTIWIFLSVLEEYMCICGTLHTVILSVGNMDIQLVKGTIMA